MCLLDATVQPPRTNPNPCASNNGGCSHICLLTPGAPWRRCACALGIRLSENGRRCETMFDGAPQNVLLIASTSGLFYISLDTDDRIAQAVITSSAAAAVDQQRTTSFPVLANNNENENYGNYDDESTRKHYNDQKKTPPLSTAPYNLRTSAKLKSSVFDSDYDPIERYVYWLAKENVHGAFLSTIQRSRLNGSDYEDIWTASADIDSFVIDWIGRNLFWTDWTNGRIEIFSLTRRLRTTLLSHKLLRPKSLVLDRARGRVYFVNYFGGETKIERVLMDGTRREIMLILPESTYLSSMVVDEDALYWADRDRSQIYKLNLNQANFHGKTTDNHIMMEIVADGLRTPHSIAKAGLSIFYNSLGARFLSELRLPKRNNSSASRTVSQSEFFELEIYGQTSLKVVSLIQQSSLEFFCHSAKAENQCEHICVQIANLTRRCLCAAEFELENDGRSCRRASEFLVFSSTNPLYASDLWRVSASIDRPPNLAHFSASSAPPTAIAVDTRNQLIYWSITNSADEALRDGAILRSPFDAYHSSEIFLESATLRDVCGIAVDSAYTGNIFICNGGLNRIEVIAARNPNLRRSLLAWRTHQIRLNLLALYAVKRTLFFTVTYTENSTVNICALRYDIVMTTTTENGTEASLLRTLVFNAGNVSALIVDALNDRLFWTTPSADGENGESLLSSIFINDALSTVQSSRVMVWLKSKKIAPTSVAISADSRFLYVASRRASVVQSLDISEKYAPSSALPNSVSSLSRHALRALHTYNDRADVNATTELDGEISHLVVAQKRYNDTDDFLNCELLENRREIFGSARRKNVFKSSNVGCICTPPLAASAAVPHCICADQMHYDARVGACRPPDDFLLVAIENYFVRFVVKRVRDAVAKTHKLSSAAAYKLDGESTLWISPVTAGIGRAKSLAFDALSRRRAIYWIDEKGKLKRAFDDISPNFAIFVNVEESKCLKFFDVSLDTLSRQIFASCSHNQNDQFNSIHLWRIEEFNEERTLRYIGVVLDGSQKRNFLPREIAVSNELGVLFYVDHSTQFDSSVIFQCSLDGRDCVSLSSTGLRAGERVILRPIGERLVYSTISGLWSRHISRADASKVLRRNNRDAQASSAAATEENDDAAVRHLLTWDEEEGGGGGLRDVVAINEILMLVIRADTKSRRSEILELNLADGALKFAPRALTHLPVMPFSLSDFAPGAQIFSAALVFRSDFRKDILYYRTPCSHISAPTPAARRALKVDTETVEPPDNNEDEDDDDDEEEDEEEEEEEEEKNAAMLGVAARRRKAAKFSDEMKCLCPTGFSISSDDPTRCARNIACAAWQFACRDGRTCVHIAQRCNRLAECVDGSDEDALTCPFHFSPPGATLFEKKTAKNVGTSNLTTKRNDALTVPLEWMCDDGVTVIYKYLLCDGKADCVDGSDEMHCRCTLPIDYFDCTAWEYHHYYSRSSHQLQLFGGQEKADCILRAALCDGRDHCKYGSDERTQLCASLPTSASFLSILSLFRSHTYLFVGVLLLAVALLLLTAVLCIFLACSKRRDAVKTRASLNLSAQQQQLIANVGSAARESSSSRPYRAQANEAEEEVEPLMLASADAFQNYNQYVVCANPHFQPRNLSHPQTAAESGNQNFSAENYEMSDFTASNQIAPLRRTPAELTQYLLPAETDNLCSRTSQHSQPQSQTSVPFCRCAKCVNLEAAILTPNLQSQQLCAVGTSHPQQSRVQPQGVHVLCYTHPQAPTAYVTSRPYQQQPHHFQLMSYHHENPLHCYHQHHGMAGVMAPSRSTTPCTSSLLLPPPPPAPGGVTISPPPCAYGNEVNVAGGVAATSQLRNDCCCSQSRSGQSLQNVQPNQMFYAPPPSVASESTYGVAKVVPTASIGLSALSRYHNAQNKSHVDNTQNDLSTTTTSNSACVKGGASTRGARGSGRRALARNLCAKKAVPLTTRHARQPPRKAQRVTNSRVRKSSENAMENLTAETLTEKEFIPPPPTRSERDSSNPFCSTPIASDLECNPTSNFFRPNEFALSEMPPPPPSSICTAST